MRIPYKLVLALLLTVGYINTFAQRDSSYIDTQKIRRSALAVGVAYTTSLLILNEVWYKGQPRESFHFFNDNREWNQMDKVGHAWTSYHLTRSSESIFLKAGMPENKAFIFGTLTSFLMLSPIELLDGYSSAYGASLGDIGANLTGSLLYGLNSKVIKKDVLGFKFSFMQTDLAALRPAVLGKNFFQELLKDYNGQTYWITINLNRSLHSSIPPWLQLALGYGAENMLYANESSNKANGYSSYRQVYIGMDIHLPDLIQSKHRWVNTLIETISVIHIPAPAFELSGGGNRFHLVK